MKFKQVWFITTFVLFLLTVLTQATEVKDEIQIETTDEQTVVAPPLSLEELESLETESYEFQTEVSRLMHLIINSLYKTREIFLRELISNASDALDKLRFLSLTQPDLLTEPLKIRIRPDPVRKTLTILDNGIGMTRDQLKENLGTIAKSGTADFLSQFESEGSQQIGQFGVGFYSVFLVADRVTVASRVKDEQYIWTSQAVHDFHLARDRRDHLTRGTEITIYLKEEVADEFLEVGRLRQLIETYSQFIMFPIELLEGDGEWHQVNLQKPIWLREPKSISDEEYKGFYKTLTKDPNDPLGWIHLKGEGETEFKSILFIPSKLKETFYDNIKNEMSNRPLQLFVKRVFISDEVDLLPRWLSFLKGLVDAEDLALNVSRETLQKNRQLKTITRHLIKKALDMFQQLSLDQPDLYGRVLTEYSNILKFGAIEDERYRKKIVSLLRFSTSHNTTAFTSSLDDYISRAKKDQKQLYYMTGSTVAEMEQSPYVERLLARGYEILYFTETLDETLIQKVPGYNGKLFLNVAKEEVVFEDEEDDDSSTRFEPLMSFLGHTLTHYVEKVVISRRLTTSPFAVVANKLGLSPHAERLLAAQMANSKDSSLNQVADFMRSQKKILEINPDHPIVKKLLEDVQKESVSTELIEMIHLLYETTAIRSGYSLRDVAIFSRRVEQVVRKVLGVSPLDQIKVNEPKAEEKTDEEKLIDEELKKTNVVYDHDEL